MKWVEAVIACGSNLGDPEKQIECAEKALSGAAGISLIKKSILYETKPVGFEAQPDFLNGAFLIETSLSPHELIGKLQGIEEEQGRTRTVQNGPRTIDLDLIFYGEEVISAWHLLNGARHFLEVPHPRMHEREFVLKPLMDIAPDWNHPTLRKTVQELYEELTGIVA